MVGQDDRQVCEEQSGRTRAEAASVYRLLADGRTWPQWSMFTAFELEREGDVDPFGVGAIRVFSTNVTKAREEITATIPDRQLEYRLLSGLPLRDYCATVRLVPDGNGTLVIWSARFGPQRVGTRWFWRVFVRWILHRTTQDLVKAADRGLDAAMP